MPPEPPELDKPAVSAIDIAEVAHTVTASKLR